MLLALFNSFYHAGLILVAVVLAMIGALLGMVVMRQPFSIIMSGTGMLALAGIVVNHNIVLIDTFHRLRDSGMDPIEAVIRSSAQRLRPVFLTTITAIGGLLPMMFAIEINFATREVTDRRAERNDVGSALDGHRVRPGVLQDDHAGSGSRDAGDCPTACANRAGSSRRCAISGARLPGVFGGVRGGSAAQPRPEPQAAE